MVYYTPTPATSNTASDIPPELRFLSVDSPRSFVLLPHFCILSSSCCTYRTPSAHNYCAKCPNLPNSIMRPASLPTCPLMDQQLARWLPSLTVRRTCPIVRQWASKIHTALHVSAKKRRRHRLIYVEGKLLDGKLSTNVSL